MKRLGIYILLLSAFATLPSRAGVLMADSVAADTTAFDSEAPVDTTTKTRRNIATEFNALDYVLSKRYIHHGEDFSNRLSDNLFFHAGIGIEKMSAPVDYYRFNALTTLHLGVGKQFNRLNSARAILHGDFGNQNGSNFSFAKVGLRLDHLFNVSAFFDGYNPSRRVEFSTIFGIGGQLSKLQHSQELSTSLEGHVGVQMKVYTGPFSSLAIEPYLGVGTDQSDISGNLNWRKYDLSIGANMSFIYYLNNNLSRNSRKRLIDERGKDDVVVGDSALQSWQQPWFLEVAAGPHFMDSQQPELSSSLGHEIAISGGKWLSPVLGLRGTFSLRSATWAEQKALSEPDYEYSATYDKSFQKGYWGVRLDALFNPLGFLRNFTWDKPWGVYLFGGAEYGRVFRQSDIDYLNCNAIAYSGGLHLWARIADGMQVFVEPRFTWYEYEIPYADVTRYMRCTDGGTSINVGITLNTVDKHFRKKPTYVKLLGEKNITVGGGLGMNFIHTYSTIGKANAAINGQVWGEYRLNDVSAVRGALDVVSRSSRSLMSYYDDDMEMPAEDETRRKERTGVWDFDYIMAMISADYSCNVTKLFCAHNPNRRFELTAFAGPSIVFLASKKYQLNSNEWLSENHAATLVEDVGGSIGIGLNVGARLTGHIYKNWSAYLSPQFTFWGSPKMLGIDMFGPKHVETLTLGVQYEL